jgi:hypothetical protein
MPPTESPFEIAEFERLLQKPTSDPTGLAGFFNAGEIIVSRVPARPRFRPRSASTSGPTTRSCRFGISVN